MAAPNLLSPTTITGKTAHAQLTDTLTAVLTNSAASGLVLKVNTIRTANLTGSSLTVDVVHNDGSTDYYVIKNGAIAGSSTLVINDKNEYIYLEEGDTLKAKASAATSIDLTINYEEIG